MQDRNPHIVVRFELIDCGLKTSGYVTIDGVASVRAIQGDEGNFARDFVSNNLRI